MSKEVVSIEHIARSIFVIRGQKVMLDFDLARLYGVTTGNLNKAVKRNREGVAMLSSVLKCTGERTRLACWRWCPHHRDLFLRRLIPAVDSRSRTPFSARRRKEHARRV